MKLKLNLNVDSAKRLLIQHGEKAAFGLAVCVLLLFLWSTLKLEVLEAAKEPGPLSALADKTKQHVISSPWVPAAKDIKIVDYPARAEHIPLSDGDYPPLVVFYDKPLWVQHDKRPIPKVLPVEELLAASRPGFLAVKRDGEDPARAAGISEPRSVSGASDSKGRGAKLSKELAPKGFFYVAVTGLVPLRKQIGAYDDAFRSAQKYDSTRDVPQFEAIKVERAEVTGQNPARAVWKEIDLAAVGSIVSTWSSESINDVVDEDYIGEYTMRLGPLVGEDWDPAVAGHPKIPLAARLDQTKKPEKEVVAAPVEPGAIFGSSKSGKKPTGTAAPKSSAPAQASKAPAGPKREQKLFRFVDYTVEPGKQYRYRVKLVLQNPNQDVADRFLKVPEQSHTSTLETEWSEPTPVVTVPRGFSIFAGPAVRPTSTPSHDPEAEVCVVSFDPQRGAEPVARKAVQRGTLLNFPARNLQVLSPERSSVSKWEKVDFQSNALIVDVEGGRKLSSGRKALIEPVEVLMLDADGQLSVHDELDDSKAFHARLDPVEKVDKEPAATSKPSANPYEDLKPKRGGTARPPRGTSPPATKAPRTPAT